MPQISQISEIFASQLFWLILCFGFIYVVIGRGMVPKIGATVEARDKRIADDLAAAEAARAEADAKDEAYRATLAENRAEAMKLTAAAKQEAALATEKRIAAADSAIGTRVSEAEERLTAAKNAALADLEGVAAEAARDMVAKLSGATVTEAQAVKAVKAALANG